MTNPKGPSVVLVCRCDDRNRQLRKAVLMKAHVDWDMTKESLAFQIVFDFVVFAVTFRRFLVGKLTDIELVKITL